MRRLCTHRGRTCNLNGSLRAAPAMIRNEAFRNEDCSLKPVRCEEWPGWIIVKLDLGAAPSPRLT